MNEKDLLTTEGLAKLFNFNEEMFLRYLTSESWQNSSSILYADTLIDEAAGGDVGGSFALDKARKNTSFAFEKLLRTPDAIKLLLKNSSNINGQNRTLEVVAHIINWAATNIQREGQPATYLATDKEETALIQIKRRILNERDISTPSLNRANTTDLFKADPEYKKALTQLHTKEATVRANTLHSFANEIIPAFGLQNQKKEIILEIGKIDDKIIAEISKRILEDKITAGVIVIDENNQQTHSSTPKNTSFATDIKEGEEDIAERYNPTINGIKLIKLMALNKDLFNETDYQKVLNGYAGTTRTQIELSIPQKKETKSSSNTQK